MSYNDKKAFFVSWKGDFGVCQRDESLRLKHDYKQHQFYFEAKDSPYVGLVNDSAVSVSFINALIKNDFDDAMSYISRFGFFVDFDLVKKIFDDSKTYNRVSVFYKNFNLIPGEKVNSFFVSDKNKKMIVHFYLVNEPDCFSKWKIYKIEEESVMNIERKRLWIKF